MNDESFINAVNYIMSKQAGLHDRLAELEEEYIEDNRMLKHGQRVWIGSKPYTCQGVRLIHYTHRLHLTYTLRPYVGDGLRVSGNWAAIQLNNSYMEDWENISVEKP